MKVAGHQPNYQPNLGFFYKMHNVDVFVIITNLKFEKREGWQRRHKIKDQGKDKWLTVPVKGSDSQLIKDVMICNQSNWRHKHKTAIKNAYVKIANQDILQEILNIYDRPYERLVDINFEIIKTIRKILGIDTKLVLDEKVSGEKEELLINICKKYGACEYVSGMGAKDYMTEKYFSAMERNGIGHHFIQRNITSKYPYCALHYLLTYGPAWVSKIVKQDED